MKIFSSKLLLFYIGIILTNVSFSQHNNNWYFGNGAGIRFNSDSPPTLLKNGELYTEEGSSAISDKNGNLLFYTNGVKVWDANHKLMEGGNSLAGGISSTQSAAIVPEPGNDNKYYIFTTDEKAGGQGLSYSIVDMTKRLGKGNVVITNRFLYGPVSEKLTVTRHANGKDYWIITHQWNTNNFAAFKLTEKGIIKAAIISAVGQKHKDYGSGNKGEAIGQLKVSPDGRMLASAMCYIENNTVELFKFNNESGEITAWKEIPTSGYAYGVEFSPNSTKLYVSFLKGNAGVIQYDLESKDIFESSYIVAKSSPNSVFGSLQIGPNNKIYVAKTGRYLDVINAPDNKQKACKYKLGGVNLGDRYCVYGLPSLVVSQKKISPTNTNASISKTTPTTSEKLNESLCSESIELDAGREDAVYLWSTGETQQKITATKVGVYTVKISDPDNVQSESVSFVVNKGEPKVDLGKDTALFCTRNYLLDAKSKGYRFKWSTKDTTQTININRSGKYSVTVTNGVCWDRDSIYVSFESYPPKFKALASFSPSNNGFNNKFDYTVGDVDVFKLRITNEKGRLVWSTENPNEFWLGEMKNDKTAPKGAYSWSVSYSGVCTFGKTIEEEGSVRLY